MFLPFHNLRQTTRKNALQIFLNAEGAESKRRTQLYFKIYIRALVSLSAYSAFKKIVTSVVV